MKKARAPSKPKDLSGFQCEVREPLIQRSFINAVRLERDLVSNFSDYPFSIPAIRHLHRLELHPAVTYLIGENGSGKSTLLEAIAVKLGYNAEGGEKNFMFATRDTTPACTNFYGSNGASARSPRIFSCGRKVSITWRPRLTYWVLSMVMARNRCIPNPMEEHSCLCS